ncbi:nucleotidyltransferase domain-containing protein [Candidatus Pacearchaeota archaeon]|nr:nucleotidyltransferase domain-containing protein [Candidatus Pacearchaeota archaeon]
MELISYAIDFVSFFIQNFSNKDKIKSIILFGSAAREEAGKESDVDIFIDVFEEEKTIDKETNIILDKFYNSTKFKNYWKPLGVKNEINIIAGKLKDWKLKDSMLGSSIILYQHYSPVLESGENKAILEWGSIKPESKRVMLNKKLFGYNQHKTHYSGLVEKYMGKRIGKNAIIINIDNLSLFLKVFNNFKISVKINRVFLYKE